MTYCPQAVTSVLLKFFPPLPQGEGRGEGGVAWPLTLTLSQGRGDKA